MDSFLLAAGSACWLGILTSISPCPLATNIAAITYIGRQVNKPGHVLLAGLLYTLGRALTYVTLGMLLVMSALSVPELALFLQRYMNKILGPVLIVTALFLLNVIRINLPGAQISERLQKRLAASGVWGAAILGLLFALSFCPVSAALFFGSLIPIAIEQESRVTMPTIYAIGTALPVVAFAILISLGTRFVGAVFNRLSVIERWARRVTGVVFLLVGVYYVLVYYFNIEVW
jgi:cytochrome c-type biogenesis protein